VGPFSLLTVWPPGYNFVIGSFMTFLIAVNFIFYAGILVAFCKRRSTGQASSASVQRSRKLTATVVTVVMITMICYSPNALFYFMPVTLENPDPIRVKISEVGLMAMIIASYLNNVIYPMRIPDYRKAYLRLLGCGAAGGSVQPSHPPNESRPACAQQANP
jgi:uncharacterized sodium:solute symporter family permease YidK